MDEGHRFKKRPGENYRAVYMLKLIRIILWIYLLGTVQIEFIFADGQGKAWNSCKVVLYKLNPFSKVGKVLRWDEKEVLGKPSKLSISGSDFLRAAQYIEELEGQERALRIFQNARDWYDVSRILLAQGDHGKLSLLHDRMKSQPRIADAGVEAEQIYIVRYATSDNKQFDPRYGTPTELIGKTVNVIFSDGSQIQQYIGRERERSRELQDVFNHLRWRSESGLLFKRHTREAAAIVFEYPDGPIKDTYWSSDKFGKIEKTPLTFNAEDIQLASKGYFIHTHPDSKKTWLGLKMGDTAYPFSGSDIRTAIQLSKDLSSDRSTPLPFEAIILPETDRRPHVYLSWEVGPVRNVILNPEE
ncbi:MAG: hypothetical protein JWQ35_857 [Bacteriovoracaceae bacterium]|nr:hypothetical protein [Bacteriovoracaceae bacterium]